MPRERIKGHVYTDRITIPTVSTRIRYRQEMHLKNFYCMLHDWLVEEGWVTREDYKWPEHFYLLRETQRGTEMWIWWRCKKIPNKNTYYRYLMDIFWHVNGAKDIEVVKDGKKFKTNYADIEFYIISEIEMDYMHEVGKGWRDNPILKHFNEAFWKRLFKVNIEKQKHELYRESYKLMDAAKLFLGLKTYLPEKEGQDYELPKGFGERNDLA